LTAFRSQACSQEFMDELRMPYITLLSKYLYNWVSSDKILDLLS
jgi:hypothetical protein